MDQRIGLKRERKRQATKHEPRWVSPQELVSEARTLSASPKAQEGRIRLIYLFVSGFQAAGASLTQDEAYSQTRILFARLVTGFGSIAPMDSISAKKYGVQ